jgi:group I intron endonuclease
MIGIYKITNPKGKVYIGQSNNIRNRFNQYKNSHFKKQYKLFYSIEKYGYDSHTFEVLEECAEDILNARERYWQDYYNVLQEGLNLHLTRTDDKPAKHSQETKQKIKESLIGRVMTDEHRKRMSIARLALPEEIRKAAGQHKKGHKESEESNKKRSEKLLGIVRSEETRNKMRKPKSKSHIENIRKAKVGLKSPIKGHPDEIITCPYCNKQGGNSGMKRWHFENCKLVVGK